MMARKDEVRKREGRITGLENEDQKWGISRPLGKKSGKSAQNRKNGSIECKTQSCWSGIGVKW